MAPGGGSQHQFTSKKYFFNNFSYLQSDFRSTKTAVHTITAQAGLSVLTTNLLRCASISTNYFSKLVQSGTHGNESN